MAQMKYRPLSLKNMAIRRLAANLFKKPTILSAISNFHSRISTLEDHYNFQVWKDTVKVRFPDEISKLWLPKPFSKLLFDIVDPMGEQVRRWKEFHEDYLRDSDEEEMHFDIPILEKLCWTSAGIVDYRKTAELLLLSGALNTVQNYKLACLYCFEDYISKFWTELSKENKKLFSKKTKSCLQSGGLGQEFWWPYIINGHGFKLHDLIRSDGQVTFYQHAFQCSARKCNKAAAEHFFTKLTYEEKLSSLMFTTNAALDSLYTIQNYMEKKFPRDRFPELLSYLLSVMTPDQQMRMLQEMPFDIFECFLNSPFPDKVLEIADNMWDFLADGVRNGVLYMMFHYSTISGDYSAKMFQEFFRLFSPDFWISFVDEQCKEGSNFQDSLLDADVKILKLFFRNLDDLTMKRFVLSDTVLRTFKDLLREGQLDVVEMCLREASLSQEERKTLKEDFMAFLSGFHVNEMKLQTRKWARFFHFLDETHDDSKRGSEDGIPTEAKKRKTYL